MTLLKIEDENNYYIIVYNNVEGTSRDSTCQHNIMDEQTK